ncbi:MAG TPA: hypothetical protein VMU08_16555 [Rhizomicrobium sp.]|nr:hypothetical protein [Rhizomicrobium sp.]
MSPLPIVFPPPAASALRASAGVRPVGNASSSCALDGEWEGGNAFSTATSRQPPRERASQNGTAYAASAWDGPRLRPAFVAQVIGQVLMDQRSCALRLAPPAYLERSRAQIAPGRFLDTGV